MGSHFHKWIDYNEVAYVFNIFTRMGSHIFAFFGVRRLHINEQTYRNVCTVCEN